MMSITMSTPQAGMKKLGMGHDVGPYPSLFNLLFMTHDNYIRQGKTLSKESTIKDYCWALLPLAKVVPAQPIHQNTLFAVLQRVLPDSPEGVVWMVVYDLRVLLQFLGTGISQIVWFQML